MGPDGAAWCARGSVLEMLDFEKVGMCQERTEHARARPPPYFTGPIPTLYGKRNPHDRFFAKPLPSRR